jgi:hypothetical protein
MRYWVHDIKFMSKSYNRYHTTRSLTTLNRTICLDHLMEVTKTFLLQMKGESGSWFDVKANKDYFTYSIVTSIILTAEEREELRRKIIKYYAENGDSLDIIVVDLKIDESRF